MQTSKKILVSLCFLSLVQLSSCSFREEISPDSGKGGIRLEISADYSSTKADVLEGQLNVDDFKIEIINSEGVIFKRWDTYAEYKEQESTAFVMNAGGPYLLRATYGDSTASGFDAFFFIGEQEFTVTPQEVTHLSVVCRMGNAKIAVKYGENIRKAYADYRTTVSSSRGGSLVFAKDCTESGYVPAGDLTVYVELEDAEGKPGSFTNAGKISAEPGDFVTLNIDSKEIPGGDLTLSVSIDPATEDHQITIDLPSDMLPADAPVIVSEGFNPSDWSLSGFVEGTLPEAASLALKVPSGIASCVIGIESASLIAAGWPAELDLVSVSPENSPILEKYWGITGSVSGEVSLVLDFRNIAKELPYSMDGTENRNEFTVRIVDAAGKKAEETYCIIPSMARKSVEEIASGNVWAARVYADLTTDGDPSLLYPEVMAEGSSEWIRPSFTSEVSGNASRVVITGLNPGTSYSVRAGYNNYTSDQARTFVTEQALQVGNSGFEEWTDETFEFVLGWSIFSRKKSIEWYRPWGTGEKWWDVNSKYTMPGNYSWIDLNQNTANFPSAAYTVEDVKAGSRSAMVYTVWTGYSIDGVDRLSNGELFIGSADDQGAHASEGHAFASRPSKLKFAYKYDAMEGENFYVKAEMRDEGGRVIASAEITDGPVSGSWQTYTLPLAYSVLDVKASSIYIIFKSTSSSAPKHTGKEMRIGSNDNGEPNVYTSGCNVGGILYLDELELVYE